MRRFRSSIVILLSYAVVAWGVAVSQAADLDQYFARNDPNSTMTANHSAWQRILDRYIAPSADGVNLFAYGRMSATDRKALKAYLTALQGVKVTALKPDEQRAFWINLYNALTIDVVLDHYPVKSIRDISLGGFFTVGPWKKELVAVEGRKLSLDNIEHDILRKVWRDPRIHYAVNCASMGCPNLMGKPFTGTTLDKMLTRGARDYVNHPRGAQVRSGKLYLSQIYSWYRKDFGSTDAAVIGHIAKYAAPKLKQQLAGINTIAGYNYDWSLNEAK